MAPRGPFRSPAQQHRLRDHVVALSWSADGGLLAAALGDGGVGVIDGTAVRAWDAHGMTTTACAWSPAGRVLASGGADRHVRWWSPDGGALGAVGGGAWVDALAWDPRHPRLAAAVGRQVAWCDAPGQMRWLDAGGQATALGWHPGGSALAVGRNRCLRVFDEDGSPVADQPCEGPVQAVAWSPDGLRIAAGRHDQALTVYDAVSGDAWAMNGYPAKVAGVAWSPDGAWLASAGGAEVVLLDTRSGRPKGEEAVLLEPHPRPVAAVAWAPDGSVVGEAAGDGTVAWTRMKDRTPRPLGHGRIEAAATAIAWSPDGRRLAAGAADGTVAVWTAR
jgi:WD40 repeat protein